MNKTILWLLMHYDDRDMIQYKDVILPVEEIPLWR